MTLLVYPRGAKGVANPLGRTARRGENERDETSEFMKLQDFIAQRPYLAWYARDVRGLSTEAIVESVLNYGDFDDVKKLFAIVGLHKTARIFRAQTRRRRNNYRPEIKHYFRLYFQRHA